MDRNFPLAAVGLRYNNAVCEQFEKRKTDLCSFISSLLFSFPFLIYKSWTNTVCVSLKGEGAATRFLPDKRQFSKRIVKERHLSAGELWPSLIENKGEKNNQVAVYFG